jgi:hypothetical protein
MAVRPPSGGFTPMRCSHTVYCLSDILNFRALIYFLLYSGLRQALLSDDLQKNSKSLHLIFLFLELKKQQAL